MRRLINLTVVREKENIIFTELLIVNQILLTITMKLSEEQ